jgi:RNA recognition motif-containing protein
LFIKNINFDTTDESFLNHFRKEGKSLASAKIVRKNQLSQGYGFVEFKQ